MQHYTRSWGHSRHGVAGLTSNDRAPDFGADNC
jgi:hypothetical protein